MRLHRISKIVDVTRKLAWENLETVGMLGREVAINCKKLI